MTKTFKNLIKQLRLRIPRNSHWGFVRKGFIAFAGGAALLLGICMLVLPGPGLLVIAGGISLLALEFKWAQELLTRVKEQYRNFRKVTG